MPLHKKQKQNKCNVKQKQKHSKQTCLRYFHLKKKVEELEADVRRLNEVVESLKKKNEEEEVSKVHNSANEKYSWAFETSY